jgi:hypothetical protein
MARNSMPVCVFLAVSCSTSAIAGRVDPSAPACGVGTLQSYIDLGSTGCSVSHPNPEIGGLTYFNFGFVSNADLPVPFSWVFPNYVPTNPLTKVADADSITVRPPQDIYGQVQFESSDFYVADGDTLQYFFTYTVDPPPDILPGFDLEMYADSPQFPGYATIDAAVCAGGKFNLFSIIFQPLACRQVHPNASSFRREPYYLHVEHSVQPNVISLSDRVVFDNATNYVQVWMLLTLSGGPAGGGGYSQIDALGVDTDPTPEPGTWAMLGAGLAGIALLRRRSRA